MKNQDERKLRGVGGSENDGGHFQKKSKHPRPNTKLVNIVTGYLLTISCLGESMDG